MNIDEAFAAIVTLVQASAGIDVHVGRPHESLNGIVLWPWRVSEVAVVRNTLPGRRTTGVDARQPAMVEVSLMLMTSPAGSETQAANILKAHQAMLDSPVVSTNNGHAQIAVEQLSAEALAAVFIAAQLPLSFCTCYSLRLAL